MAKQFTSFGEINNMIQCFITKKFLFLNIKFQLQFLFVSSAEANSVLNLFLNFEQI